MRDASVPIATASHCRQSWRVRATDQPRPLIYCFIASHISSRDRLDQLARTLQSILAQSPAPPLVAISWSATAELAASVREVLSRSEASGLPLQQLEQREPHSQFEHLRALTELHAVRPPSWILFSDDDDLWSERRHALYARECERAPFAVRTVLCRRKMCPRYGVRGAMPVDAREARAMMRGGFARYTDADLRDGLHEDEHNMAEYFDFAVRYEVLARFFAEMPRTVTRHRYCDLGFAFLCNVRDGTSVRFMPSDDAEFVYFYARGNRPGGASNTSALSADEERVVQAEATRAASLVGGERGGLAATLTAAEMAKLLLQQALGAIEQEMVKLRVTGGVLPLQLVQAACTHQAAVVLQSHQIDLPQLADRLGVDTPIGGWLAEAARGPLRDLALTKFRFEALVDWHSWSVSLFATERDARAILAQSCGYTGGGVRVPRVGMWAGGTRPPIGLSIGTEVAMPPETVFRPPAGT